MQFHARNFSTEQNIKQNMLCSVFISQHAKDSYTYGMDIDVFETRKINLAALIEPRGKAADIAEKLGSSASYLSTVKSGKRRMGADVARRIEEVEKLPHGWMDRLHGKDAVSQSVIIEASSPEDLATKLSAYDAQKMLDILQMAMKLKDAEKNN